MGTRDPADEVRVQRIGAATVMARLVDIVVTRVVRVWVEAHGDTTGWLAAIRDPQIGSALAAFHCSPERAWSVDVLAAAAGMSRSQFSERFTAALGMVPARYVATWRMHLATRWLTASDRRSARSRRAWATSPSLRSAARSSGSSASRPASCAPADRQLGSKVAASSADRRASPGDPAWHR